MHFGQTLTVLLGFSSLATAVPTAVEHKGDIVSGASRHKRPAFSSASFVNETQVGSTNVGKIGVIDQLAQISQFAQLVQIAEAQLLAQVQSQILLAAQLQTIKNNIRINTFKARFPQVNTVIVTVTNVIDARDALNVNRRYLLDHLLVDNGFTDKEQVIMVTEAQAMTITADATAATSTSAPTTTEATDVTSTLDIAALLSSALVARATGTASADASSSASAAVTPASTFPVPLGVGGIATQIISQQSNIVSVFNPADPFGFPSQAGSGSLLLPYDTTAPSSQLILEDPANIIFAGNHNLLVQSIGAFQADCFAFGLGGNAFLGGAAGLNLFGSVQQAIIAQLTTIQIGNRVQGIPPAILLGHPDLAAGLKSFQFSEDGKVAETLVETAGESAKEMKKAKTTESKSARA